MNARNAELQLPRLCATPRHCNRCAGRCENTEHLHDARQGVAAPKADDENGNTLRDADCATCILDQFYLGFRC